MCACVQPPPYMLGERPTPLHGGSGALSFRQVPFVRVNERVESGIKVRKQLRKYLKTSSTTQHLVAQMHLQDACVPAMQPQEVSQSCFESFFVQMKTYNHIVGQKHMEASKALLEMARPLDNSGKSRKWAKDAYNLVQKCVQDVNLAEKKMEKVKIRKERADDELCHWKKVLEANEATYQVQPNSPEVQRAYQLAQYRFMSAFAEEEAAAAEFEEAKSMFYASIERRDQVVEEATELSQSMEEDRMETMLIVMKQFVETKKAILQAEIEAISNMQRILSEMDKESVIQQYIVDAMAPDLTHRQAKALYLLEWHRTWHNEQRQIAADEPPDLLSLSLDDAGKIKSSTGVSLNDIEVIKDFVVSCFTDPDRSILSGKLTSTKHRARFTDKSALAMYRIEVVRKTVLQVLHHQRTHSLELSSDGFFQLSAALWLLLDACSESDDARTIKSVMNMAQTFFKLQEAPVGGTNEPAKDYVLTPLLDHTVWNIPQYWGNALLLSIGDELSKNPQDVAWYHLANAERVQLVLQVHNMVFGQVTSFLYNLESFGFSRRQIQQYVQNVCFAYELAEDQRISLLQSANTLGADVDTTPSRLNEQGEEVQFTALTLPDWTYLGSGMPGGEKLRGFRGRTSSTHSDARSTSDSIASSMVSSVTSSSTNGMIKDLEEMKQRAAAMISLSSSLSVAATPRTTQESWQDLFGSAPPGGASGGGPGSADGDAKRNKMRKNSRKFNEQLRMARGQSLNARIGVDDGHDMAVGAPPTPTQISSHSLDVALQPVAPHVAHTTTGSSRPSTPDASSGRKYSMDDSSVLLKDETEHHRRRHHARLGKARSVATIDTSDFTQVDVSSHTSFHVAQSPIVALGASTITTTTTTTPSATATPTPTGMDHIKAIAARMKSRREQSGSFDLTPARASPDAGTIGADLLMPARQLRKAPGSSKNFKDTASSGASNLGNGNANGNGTQGTTAAAAAAGESVPLAATASPSPSLASGVAALRARFEKK